MALETQVDYLHDLRRIMDIVEAAQEAENGQQGEDDIGKRVVGDGVRDNELLK